jgi:hypothetical protein
VADGEPPLPPGGEGSAGGEPGPPTLRGDGGDVAALGVLDEQDPDDLGGVPMLGFGGCQDLDSGVAQVDAGWGRAQARLLSQVPEGVSRLHLAGCAPGEGDEIRGIAAEAARAGPLPAVHRSVVWPGGCLPSTPR